MTTETLFNYNFHLDVPTDVAINVSAGQSYSNLGSYGTNHPWHLDIYVDGGGNNGRGGSGAVSDTISCIGAVSQLAPGDHNIKVMWFGDSTMTLSGAVMTVLFTKR